MKTSSAVPYNGGDVVEQSYLRKIIVNADDFGISPDVNRAVIEAFKFGTLNSASLMLNVAYTDEAIKLIGENPALKIGVHLNLTKQKNQKPLSDPTQIPLLVDGNGLLKHGFFGLLLLSIFRKKELQRQGEIEMRRQIKKAIQLGINVEHLDSHRHIHLIPALFVVAEKLQKEFQIQRLRVVNENFWRTIFTAGDLKCFLDGGVVKYLILKTFYYFNRTKSDTYFYSILYTTRLFEKNVDKIKMPSKYEQIELCLHPSCIEEDKKIKSPAFADYLLYSQNRQKEFETAMNLNLKKKIFP